MSLTKRILVAGLVIGMGLGEASAQFLEPPGSRPAPASAPASQPGAGSPAPVQLDRANRQVVVDAVVAQPQGVLEFLLCKEGTKDYESLLVTKASPSSVHAALLALGLMPGKPARWTTPPGKQAVFLPPAGAMLEITIRQADAKGFLREVPATDWLKAQAAKKKADPTRWVFVGSDFLDDGRYWADVEGNIVSLANFAASVVDVPFKSTDKNAFLEFSANGDAVPAKGTAVKLVLTAVKGAETAEEARLSFTVDSLGRVTMDGTPIAMEDVAEAAKKFLSQHAKGSADVRMDARALVYDRDRLQETLQEAGLTDVTFRTRMGEEQLLPRTAAQAAQALGWWKQQFAQAKDLIVDPAEDAAATLVQIERQRRQLQDLSELWGDYAAQLRKLLADHRAAQKTPAKPAGQGAP